MQGFSKQYVKKRQDRPVIKDTYDIEVENMAKKSQGIDSRQFTQFAGRQQALYFLKRFYMIALFGFTFNVFAYPLSVRIVKKAFGLKSFFNIHFAAFPILLNFNAVVIGVAQAVFNYVQVKRKYENPSVKKRDNN